MISPSYEKIYISKSWNFKIINFCLKQFIFGLSEVAWIFWQQNVSLLFLCHYQSFMGFIFMKNNLKIVRYWCTTKRENERIVTILQSVVWKWDSMKLHETRNSLINSMIWKDTQQWNNFIFENLNVSNIGLQSKELIHQRSDVADSIRVILTDNTSTIYVSHAERGKIFLCCVHDVHQNNQLVLHLGEISYIIVQNLIHYSVS